MSIKDSYISFGTMIFCDETGEVSICNTFIGRNCIIVSKEKITIHENCLIAEMVVVRDQDHSLNPTDDGQRIGFKTAPVEILRGVWIGSKATVLKGVIIGQNSVLAASAIARENIPNNEIWGGIPSRFIGKIKTDPR